MLKLPVFGLFAPPKRTLLNYFNRFCDGPSDGVVSFHRCRLETFPDWSTAPEQLQKLRVDSRGLIEEEGKKYIQMDFANKERLHFVLIPWSTDFPTFIG